MIWWQLKTLHVPAKRTDMIMKWWTMAENNVEPDTCDLWHMSYEPQICSFSIEICRKCNKFSSGHPLTQSRTHAHAYACSCTDWHIHKTGNQCSQGQCDLPPTFQDSWYEWRCLSRWESSLLPSMLPGRESRSILKPPTCNWTSSFCIHSCSSHCNHTLQLAQSICFYNYCSS